MRTKISSLCLVLIIWASGASAQCGTKIPKDLLLVQDELRTVTDYYLNKTVSVTLYFVASGYQQYDFGIAAAENDWTELNELFEPIGLRFEICNTVNIPNYNWNILDREVNPETGFNEEDEMRAQFYVPNVINVYYVGQTLNDDVAGYAYFPGGWDIIVLTKGSGFGTLAHEMGHFFGLYHTFETDNGFEFSDGSNCETTGDLVCDTPADNNGPFLEDECKYNSTNTDPNGDFYTPYLSNIMSYYGACTCKFTPGQYNRMAWMYLNERNYLW